MKCDFEMTSDKGQFWFRRIWLKRDKPLLPGDVLPFATDTSQKIKLSCFITKTCSYTFPKQLRLINDHCVGTEKRPACLDRQERRQLWTQPQQVRIFIWSFCDNHDAATARVRLGKLETTFWRDGWNIFSAFLLILLNSDGGVSLLHANVRRHAIMNTVILLFAEQISCSAGAKTITRVLHNRFCWG